MLLSNVSVIIDGCKKLMQEGEALEGLYVRLLVQWFVQSPDIHADSKV